MRFFNILYDYKRLAIDKLILWKNSRQRKPLVLKGPCRLGHLQRDGNDNCVSRIIADYRSQNYKVVFLKAVEISGILVSLCKDTLQPRERVIWPGRWTDVRLILLSQSAACQ